MRLVKARRTVPITVVKYFLLISFGFVYLYPIIFMIGYSFMGAEDLRNQLVHYVPTRLDFSNYTSAILVLDYWQSLWTSVYVSVLPAITQSIATCITAYGLARYKFPGRSIVLGLIIATFIIPPVITMMPQFLMYQNMGLTETPLVFILPASLGQGLRSSILILVFYQILSSIPTSLEEAARIDGAGAIKLFVRIAVPLAKSGFVIAFIFSLIWYWNETTLSTIYMGNTLTTLPMRLERFAMIYAQMRHGGGAAGGGALGDARSIDQAIYMAGTMLNVIPLLLFYFFTQKQFVESVERSGITGE